MYRLAQWVLPLIWILSTVAITRFILLDSLLLGLPAIFTNTVLFASLTILLQQHYRRRTRDAKRRTHGANPRR